MMSKRCTVFALVLIFLTTAPGAAQQTIHYGPFAIADCGCGELPGEGKWTCTLPAAPLALQNRPVTNITVQRYISSVFFGVWPVIETSVSGIPLGAPLTVTDVGDFRTFCVTNEQTFTSGTVASGLPGFEPKHDNSIVFQNDSIGDAFCGFATFEYTFGPPQNPYVVQLEINTDPGNASTFEKPNLASGAGVNVQLALGSVFAVKLAKRPPGGGTTVPLDVSYAIAGDFADPGFETPTNLFREGSLVSTSGGVGQGQSTEFVSVHLGQASIQLLPLTESGVAPFYVHVTTIRPAALGQDHNDWDARIIEAAHERGIPPQIIKGQIRQESPGFNGDEMRYEPCSSDFAAISGGPKIIDQEPFSLYAMDSALSDAEMTETIDLRNALYIFDPATHLRRRLNHGDTNVSARDIWDANDKLPPNQNWSTNACGARALFLRRHNNDMAAFLDALDFTAQTPTASSYGVLQALYSTAIGYGWSVPDPTHPGATSRSPRYLRDSAEALGLRHGGSLFVGGHEDVRRYLREYQGVAPSFFSSREEFWDSFKEPLRHYTGGGVASYGINIVDTDQFDYLPVQPATVFP